MKGIKNILSLRDIFFFPNPIDIADLLDDFFEAVNWEMEMRKCLYGVKLSN